MKIFYCLMLSAITYSACGQTKSDRQMYAEKELKLALTDKTLHNVIGNNNIILKDSLTAIKIIEPILFSIYGKDNITEQRPYSVYFIDNYWVINGTMKKVHPGGVFSIIIDARNCQVIRITHGK